MPTIRENIIAAVAARLVAVAGVTFERMPSAEPDTFPALSLDDRGQQVLERDALQTRYALILAVEGRVQGSGGAAAHQALNTLYESTLKAVMADDLRSVAGVESIEEGDLSVDISALAVTRTLAFTLVFEIQFINRSTDPALI